MYMNLKLIFIIWVIAFVIGSIVSLIRYLVAKRQFDKMVTEEIRRIQELYKYEKDGINRKIEL